MHSFWYRANAVLTFGVTMLAVMCILASLSDNFNLPSPSAEVKAVPIELEFRRRPPKSSSACHFAGSTSWSCGKSILNINWFQKQANGNDEVSMTLNVSSDLSSLFTWNTKQVFVFVAAEYETPQNALNQVSLWDGIIPSKEHSKFWIHTTNKYRFVDQGSNLKGKDFNLTLHWHIMPKTGKMFADKIVMTGYRLPEEYR